MCQKSSKTGCVVHDAAVYVAGAHVTCKVSFAGAAAVFVGLRGFTTAAP